jgi:hypothetical protein
MDFNKKIFALILESMHGCQFSCTGCTVNKEASSLPDKAGFEKIKLFLDDLEANGTELNEFEIAPTDIITSLNRNEFFGSEDAISLMQRFRIFTMNVSLILPTIDPYVELAKQLNATGYKKLVEIVTPVEFLHIQKPKYMGLIEKNLKALKDSLESDLIEVNLAINFDKRFIGTRDLNSPSIDELFDRIHDFDFGITTKINFVFPHARRPRDTLFLKEDMEESIHEVNKLYLRHLKRRGKDGHLYHVPYQFHDFARGGEGTWFKGELYLRPVINERYAMVSEDIRLKGDWTYENFVLFNHELSNLYIEKGSNMSDCKNCSHLMVCADRGVQEVMQWMDTESCIMLLKDHGHLSPLLMNAEFDKIDWDKINVCQSK